MIRYFLSSVFLSVLVFLNPAAGNAQESILSKFLPWDSGANGVVTTSSGLEYKVIDPGDPTGLSPQNGEFVTVHYEGRLSDGTIFDSSFERGKPELFPSDKLISGWVEALSMMKPGDDWILHIPSELAYGERGTPGGPIPPNADLIFEVLLLEVRLDGVRKQERERQQRAFAEQERQVRIAAEKERVSKARINAEIASIVDWERSLSSKAPWTNMADLFQYDPAKTASILSDGHKIVFEVSEISFLDGNVVATGEQGFTDIYEGIEQPALEQIEENFSWDLWNKALAESVENFAPRKYTYSCKLAPKQAAGVKQGSSYVFTAKLIQLANERAVFDCKLEGPA